MISLLIKIVCVYCVWLIVGCAMQRKMLFPGNGMKLDFIEIALPHETDWINSDDAKVEMWFFPGKGVDNEHPGPVLFHAHGNGELIDYWPHALMPYMEMGISVVLIEYRGYGRSTGSPSQAGITKDFVAAYDRVMKRSDVDTGRVIFHGRSLGGGVVCALAEYHEPDVLILESSFTSVAAMAGKFLIPRFALLDPFDNDKFVAKYDKPVLLIHGKRDRIISYSHSIKLDELAKNSRFVSLGCGHNDMPHNSIAYWDPIKEFLKSNGMVE